MTGSLATSAGGSDNGPLLNRRFVSSCLCFPSYHKPRKNFCKPDGFVLCHPDQRHKMTALPTLKTARPGGLPAIR